MTLSLRAKFLFPGDGPPIEDGVVTFADGIITAVGRIAAGRSHRDLGGAAILPGLINAHTHLEFSDLASPLGEAGMPLADWIADVVAWRRVREASPRDGRGPLDHSVARGLADSIRHGTTQVGEIATLDWPSSAFRASPLGCTVFLELLGLSKDRVEPLLTAAAGHLETASNGSATWRPGIGPHAPYTVHPRLLTEACRLSRKHGVPLAMHLAETEDELELLESGSGRLIPLLESLDAWHPAVIPRGSKPLDYLHELAKADRALVVHGNYLSAKEIAYLAQNDSHMSLVYCPRTHAYFEHPPYPLESMLRCGVNVALGTDSRASNPDLSILEEMRFVYRHHKNVDPSDILRMGTINGAQALGLDDETGTIEVGKRADFTVVELPEEAEGAPYQQLFGLSAKTSVRCWIGGREWSIDWEQ
jgi:cytosine/adenosine deaminase-related metal-dependent hydrolase